MKEKDLYIDFKPQQHIYYVENEDNQYEPIISGSQLSKNYLDDYWEKRRNLESNLRKKLQDNQISPIYYFMLLQELGEGDLASRIGISVRRLRKHLTMDYFKKLKLQTIKSYAEVFNIPVANMFQILIAKQDETEKIGIEQILTSNPFIVTTKVNVK